MPGAHRQDDSRHCNAKTIVTGQSTVFVNGKLWAVENDSCNHLSGQLIAVTGSQNVFINGKRVIVAPGDQAYPDSAGHVAPNVYPKTSSSNVSAY